MAGYSAIIRDAIVPAEIGLCGQRILGGRSAKITDNAYKSYRRNLSYADSVNPTMTDDHTLAFSNIRLARNGVDLRATNRIGQTATIGHLKDGLFGKEVVLNKGVDFKVHRVHGAIHASLVYISSLFGCGIAHSARRASFASTSNPIFPV